MTTKGGTPDLACHLGRSAELPLWHCHFGTAMKAAAIQAGAILAAPPKWQVPLWHLHPTAILAGTIVAPISIVS